MSNTKEISWKTYKLKDLIYLMKRGITPKYVDSNGYLILNQKCIRNGKITLDDARYTSKDSPIPQEKFLQKNDVLINSTGVGTLGRVACCNELIENKNITVDSHVTIIRPNNNLIDSLFLKYNLQMRQSELESLCSGSSGQLELSRNRVENMQILVPSNLREQVEIVKILDTASEMIRLRQECINHTNNLIPALFQEIFKKKSSDFQKEKIGKIFSLSSGKFLPAKDMNNAGKYPVYGGNGINGYHDEYLFDKSKICIGRVGVKCGCIHETEPYSWITDNALYLDKLYSNVNLKYIKYALEQINLNQYAKKAAQPVISQGTIYQQFILMPPIEVQNQFAEKAQEIEEYKKQQYKELKYAQQLFNSLLNKAFTGELTQNLEVEA